MHISYIKPLLNYGRFILEEQRKRKIVEGQLPKIAMPKLLFQRNPLQPYIKTEQTDISTESKQSNFNLYFPSSALANPYNLVYTEGDEAADDIRSSCSEEEVSNTQNFVKKSIFSKQYAANSEIEDRISVGVLTSLKNSFMVNVFDGHGGYILAEYCSQNIIEVLDRILQKKLQSSSKKQEIPDIIIESLKQAYQTLENDFYENVYLQKIHIQPRSKDRNVGACGISVLLYDNQIYSANCGDSQAILISGSKQEEYHYQFKKLNERLSVNNPHQRNRLLIEFPDEDILIEQSKGVYYLKGRLQPTRSLGDFYLKKKQLWKGKSQFNGPYLTCIPDVNVYDVKETSKRIIVASDGIWDFIDKWSLTKLSATNIDKTETNISKVIVKETLKRAAKMHNKKLSDLLNIPAEQKRRYHDDISVIVVELDDYQKMVKCCSGMDKQENREQTLEKDERTNDNQFEQGSKVFEQEELEWRGQNWEWPMVEKE